MIGKKEFSMMVCVSSMFGIVAVLIASLIFTRCDKSDVQQCWVCSITTKYTDSRYPHLMETTGKFKFCDQNEAWIRNFEKCNTVQDSVMIQSCQCTLK